MTNYHDLEYNKAIRTILDSGIPRSDRTGVGTISEFGLRQVYSIRHSFPAITTKKLAFDAVKSELLWFIEGSGDERRLAEILHGTRDSAKKTIWTGNAEADYWLPKAAFPGDLGVVYGVQWRDWIARDGSHIDQLQKLVEGLKKDPGGRRHILTAWNVGELDNMALPPCHCFAQFYVNEGSGTLDCQMYQRSCDFFLGVPFNIASYALLTRMIAQVVGLSAGRLIHINGDAHIYQNHLDQVQTQLSREPFAPPTLWLNPEITDITKFTMSDIKLVNYQSHPAIKAPMAV